ncbi:MAG: DNA recombination protein RmuC [Candidatus Cloacimonetes bacterium]|nr:DNA recombination protein RmuC [Candidatus Cloacimonadota bacterium]
MNIYFLIAILVLQLLSLLIILMLFFRKEKQDLSEISYKLSSFESQLEKTYNLLREELGRNREEFSNSARHLREETNNSIKLFQETFISRMNDVLTSQKSQMNEFSEKLDKTGKTIEDRLEKMRATIEVQLKSLQEENSKKLDEMRNVVDEKLQSTLEKRLGESFKQVSERLEQVHQGLGDMKNLAAGVGDLKKVLSNVKTRGILGEYQLENLLEQLFSPEQYEKEVRIVEGSSNRVDFAIKLPGREDSNQCVYLPVDAKFPLDDFYMLQDAYELGNVDLIDEKRKALGQKIKSFAKDISEKYIHPPQTTDFAILFLPSEGVFAEILGKTDLFDVILREYRVLISGPTTLAAFLNSLQMGFRTLAIQKRSSEVWQLLGSVKREFSKFGDILKKAQRNINTAGQDLETLIGTRTRAIERKLRDVQELPTNVVEEISTESLEEEEEIEDNKEDI